MVSTTTGRPLTEELISRVAAALIEAYGAAGDGGVHPVPEGSNRAVLALSRDGVAPRAVGTVLDVLPEGVPRPLIDARLEGWGVTRVAVDWLPGLAPTTSRTYEVDGGGSSS